MFQSMVASFPRFKRHLLPTSQSSIIISLSFYPHNQGKSHSLQWPYIWLGPNSVWVFVSFSSWQSYSARGLLCIEKRITLCRSGPVKDLGGHTDSGSWARQDRDLTTPTTRSSHWSTHLHTVQINSMTAFSIAESWGLERYLSGLIFHESCFCLWLVIMSRNNGYPHWRMIHTIRYANYLTSMC